MMHAAPIARGSTRIERKVGWAEALPLGDGEFDLVTMGYALRHMADLNTAFAELRTIRKTVFIDEQNVPEDLEWDG